MQALVTLNDTAFVECAKALGEKLESGFSSGTISERLSLAYLLVTGRNPPESSLRELVTLYEATRQEAPSQAATVVAQVLLNLDESLTY